MNIKTLSIFLAGVLLACLTPLNAETNHTQALEKAPLNPDFIRYLKDKENYLLRINGSGLPTGKLPAPVDLSHLKGKNTTHKTTVFPTTFDLRNQGKVTPVKNQGSCGACWAFGTYASLESCLLPGEESDFAEVDMVHNHGFDYGPCEGGSEFISTAYLARWGGPLPEGDMPYNYSTFSSGNEGLVCKHVQQVVLLPGRENYLDNAGIKDALMNNGAIAISFHIDESSQYYNRQTAAYYCFKNEGINHMVTVVGWDDNFPAEKFPTSPPGNGAFITKNSWDTDFGEEGYFYLSYYDKTFSRAVLFNNAESYTNYGTNYQYDPFGWHTNWGYANPTAYAANIFQAVNNQPLRAVGFYVNDTGANVWVSIYKGVSAGNPGSGNLITTKTAAFLYPGYYTVKLNSAVPLNKGQLFSVVLKIENDSYPYPIAVEYPFAGYSSNASANPGESFTSDSGSNWEDITAYQANANVCIKAFAGFSGANLDVDAVRETVCGWLVTRDIGRISICINNLDDISISKIIIYRRASPLSPYTACKEILPGELEAGSYTYTDFDIQGKQTQYYKVAVLNDSGVVCGRSDEKTI